MHVNEAFENASANSTMNSFFPHYDFMCKFSTIFSDFLFSTIISYDFLFIII